MDIMKKIERLADLAAARSNPLPLDTNSVMLQIRALRDRDDDAVMSVPLGFFAGGAALAAAAAIAVTLFAVTAWTDMSSPFAAVESLLDLQDVL
ncbi:MAG: hypothetical protein LUG50_03815 [Planctomycetaceae bacterium]|nr:hypothetical protein [Planctomycetaceae bacterium]